MFSKQGRLALRSNLLHAIIIILCVAAILGIAIVVKGLLYGGKRKRTPQKEDRVPENHQQSGSKHNDIFLLFFSLLSCLTWDIDQIIGTCRYL